MYALDRMRGVLTPSSECRRTASFNYPLQKDRRGNYKVKSGERIRVNMTSDTFLEEADAWRDEMWDVIRKRPDVLFWILTKRPERVVDHLPSDWGSGWDNVVMNVTCENQEMFDKRFTILARIPAQHKGLCLAPLIGPIDVTPACQCGWIDEIAVGGENYENPRIICHEWVEDISKVCDKYRVNFVWHETGTNLVKNGQRFILPYKAEQTKAAFFAGLNRKFYDVHYDLRMPDGTEVEFGREKRYNLSKCLCCSNQLMCNGCSGCGECRSPINLVSKEVFFDRQNAFLRSVNRQDLILEEV